MLKRHNVWFVQKFLDDVSHLLPNENSIFFPLQNDSTLREQAFAKYMNDKIITIVPSISELLNDYSISLDPNCTSFRRYKQDHYVDWHIDYDHEPLKENIEYECIITLYNSTDSVTKTDSQTFRTEMGSLMIVCHNGANHCVTKVTNFGERLILRFKLNSLSSINTI